MTKWTKESVPSEFKRLLDSGLTYMDIRRKYSGLLSAVIRLYGGVIPLCIHLGIDYTTVVSKGMATKYKIENSTVDEINEAIINLFSSRSYVKVKDIEVDGEISWVYRAAIRVYGDWNTALRNNGVTPCKKEVKGLEPEIINLYSSGNSGREISEKLGVSESSVYVVLKANDVNVDGYRYRRGIKANGQKAFDKYTTMEFVRNLIKLSSTKRITTDMLRESHPIEFFSIKHHFKSLTNAIKESGEYVLDCGVPKSWNKRFLLDQIKLGYSLDKPLNNEYMTRGFGCSAETFARQVFGSWRNAVIAAGIDYDKVSLAGETLAPLGHEFEKVFSKILTDLGVQYSKYDHEIYKPDFVIGTEWIDAKLSKYTYKAPDKQGRTVLDKYEPYCDKLTIVFLRGEKGYDAKITDKTRLISVYKYVDRLPAPLRSKYYEKLNEIEQKADAV